MGCRSALPETIPVEPAPDPVAVKHYEPGTAVVIQRPTPDVVLLSLWVDAGSRAAAVPQLAVASAFWAAQQAGAEPHVLPEGTEFTLLCGTASSRVERCAERLSRVLAPPVPSEEDVRGVRERLRRVRARAAHDAWRHSEQLALEALFGAGAAPLFPLGNEADDARVSPAAIRDFIEHHYAASRALLIGVGDLKKDALDSVVRGFPRRGSALRERRVVQPEGGLKVAFGERGTLSLALTASSVARAASLCEQFRSIHGDARASISALRGAVVAHLTLPAGSKPLARLQSAVFDLRRLELELREAAELPPPDSLQGIARDVGETWIARGEPRTPVRAGALGVALVLAQTTRSPDEPNARLAELEAAARAAVDAGEHNSLGKVSAKHEGRALHATTENGAELDLVRRPGARWFAASVRFTGGSETDAPTSHGRAALLATLMADGCGIATGRTLDQKLETLKARLWPMVDAQGLGVGISAPQKYQQQALDLLLRCALRPSFRARAVEDARARLIQSLWRNDVRELEAMLAQLLAPAAPGAIAPWGSPAGVARIDAGELQRLHHAHLLGPAIKVWATTADDPARLSRFISRRLAYLRAEAPEAAAPQLGASEEMSGALVRDPRLRVLIGMRVADGTRADLAAQVFADALARALRRRVGHDSWSLGRSAHGLSFAGVGLTLREDQLEHVRSYVAEALSELRTTPDETFRLALEKAQIVRSARLSSARGWVEAAFADQASGALDIAHELKVVRALIQAAPSYFVLRPQA